MIADGAPHAILAHRTVDADQSDSRIHRRAGLHRQCAVEDGLFLLRLPADRFGAMLFRAADQYAAGANCASHVYAGIPAKAWHGAKAQNTNR